MAFVIPVNHNDLLLQRDDNRFSCQESKLGKTATVVSKLEDVLDSLRTFNGVEKPETFSLLFSSIRLALLFLLCVRLTVRVLRSVC